MQTKMWNQTESPISWQMAAFVFLTLSQKNVEITTADVIYAQANHGIEIKTLSNLAINQEMEERIHSLSEIDMKLLHDYLRWIDEVALEDFYKYSTLAELKIELASNRGKSIQWIIETSFWNIPEAYHLRPSIRDGVLSIASSTLH